jgi:hypothetical protein
MLSQLEIVSPRTDEACFFLKFSPCFSVKFARFGEHFSLKTPIECVYVCLLIDLLISLYFNRKFTRKLHYFSVVSRILNRWQNFQNRQQKNLAGVWGPPRTPDT